MRSAYNDNIGGLARDLTVMSDYVRTMMRSAGHSLLDRDLSAAEGVVSSIDSVEDLRATCEARAFELLALEAPVARDLRQVVSGFHIVEDLARMAALAVHVAKTTRRRHPDAVVPEALAPYFREFVRLSDANSGKLHEILATYEPERAMELALDDDAVDDIQHHIMQLTTARDCPHGVTAAVDVVLLSRYFERYNDHAVNIGTRVVYLATGMQPAEYEVSRRTEEQQATMREQFNEIRRRYGEA
ncbi:PhoU family transcriptional regulator [Corynebacterium bovis]|uniref:phosphate signaling complex PhoU family protein n=1 Tax=Corynebacterium bovis TaxID=36808 RepID=UPI00313979B0